MRIASDLDTTIGRRVSVRPGKNGQKFALDGTRGKGYGIVAIYPIPIESLHITSSKETV